MMVPSSPPGADRTCSGRRAGPRTSTAAGGARSRPHPATYLTPEVRLMAMAPTGQRSGGTAIEEMSQEEGEALLADLRRGVKEQLAERNALNERLRNEQLTAARRDRG